MKEDEKMAEKINRTQWLTRTAMLLAVVLAVQAMGLPQLITGSLVNAVLILAVMFSGIYGALLIGSITPWLAFILGILPPALAPLLPVIMLANLTLAVVFYLGQKIHPLAAAVLASAGKYLIFFVSINYLLRLFAINLPAKLVAAFGLTQLATALIGSLCAVIIGRSLQRVIEPQ